MNNLFETKPQRTMLYSPFLSCRLILFILASFAILLPFAFITNQTQLSMVFVFLFLITILVIFILIALLNMLLSLLQRVLHMIIYVCIMAFTCILFAIVLTVCL